MGRYEHAVDFMMAARHLTPKIPRRRSLKVTVLGAAETHAEPRAIEGRGGAWPTSSPTTFFSTVGLGSWSAYDTRRRLLNLGDGAGVQIGRTRLHMLRHTSPRLTRLAALPPGCGGHPQPDPLGQTADRQPDHRSGDHGDLEVARSTARRSLAVLREEA